MVQSGPLDKKNEPLHLSSYSVINVFLVYVLQEASMLQCSVGKEHQRLKEGEVQQRQKLEAASYRISDLESQLTKKDQLILDQKKLLEDTKAQSRSVSCRSGHERNCDLKKENTSLILCSVFSERSCRPVRVAVWL